MDNFLTMLYFEKFKTSERESGLMQKSTEPQEDTENGRYNHVRIDQSITEVRRQGEMISKFIDAYLIKIKSE